MGDAVWSKGDEETRSGGKEGTVFQVWRRRTQEVGVSKEDGREKKEAREGTTTRGMEEGEGTL